MRTLAILAPVVVLALLAACVPVPAPAGAGRATPADAHTPVQAGETPIPAEAAAQAAIAAQLGVPEGQITILSVEHVEWPDACLGAAAEGDMCAQVITPGYRIVMEVDGKQYEAHTDESGQSVRIVTS